MAPRHAVAQQGEGFQATRSPGLRKRILHGKDGQLRQRCGPAALAREQWGRNGGWLPTNVVKTIISHHMFDGLNNPFSVIRGMVYYCCNHNILISLIYEPHIWQDNWEPYGNHAITILIMGWNGHMTIFHHLFCDLGVSEHRGKKHAHPTKKCHIIRPHDLDLFIGSHKKNQKSRQLTCLVGGLNPSEKY